MSLSLTFMLSFCNLNESSLDALPLELVLSEAARNLRSSSMRRSFWWDSRWFSACQTEFSICRYEGEMVLVLGGRGGAGGGWQRCKMNCVVRSSTTFTYSWSTGVRCGRHNDTTFDSYAPRSEQHTTHSADTDLYDIGYGFLFFVVDQTAASALQQDSVTVVHRQANRHTFSDM